MFSTETQQPILIVTGMHRSGTSLTASLLQSAGLDIGQNLLDKNESNPKGYFENTDFLAFHESVLHAIGISTEGWTIQQNIIVPEYFIDEAKQLIQKSASDSQPWGWKEPRTTLFLNFWGSLLSKAKFLFIYRSPWEVLDSLFRRGDPTFCHHPEFALKTWMDYNQKILDFYRHESERCLLFNISQVTQNFSAVIEAIQQKLGIELHAPTSDLYDPSLLQQSSPYSQRQMLIQNYFPDAFALYGELNATSDFIDGWEHDNGMVAQASTTSTSWLLQDWLDLRHLERNSKPASQLHQTQVDLHEAKTQSYEANAQLHQTQVDLHEAKTQSYEANAQLHQTQVDLHEAKTQSYEANAQLHQTQIELHEANAKLHEAQVGQYQVKEQLCETQSDLENAKNQIWELQTKIEVLDHRLTRIRAKRQEIRATLDNAQNEINAMQTSKFWKLREKWFRFKNLLGQSK